MDSQVREAIAEPPKGTITMPQPVPVETALALVFDAAAVKALATAEQKGWWDQDGPQKDGEQIALMHSELSEALEALRNGDPESEKIPGFKSSEEEYADVIIRIMNHGAKRGLRVGAAIAAKMAYNETRPHKHGGKLF